MDLLNSALSSSLRLTWLAINTWAGNKILANCGTMATSATLLRAEIVRPFQGIRIPHQSDIADVLAHPLRLYSGSLPFTSRLYQVHGIGSVGEPFLWHVDVDENMLVIFEINWSMLPVEVQESKWTLNGKLLDRKCVDVSLSGRRLDEIRVLPAMNLRHSKYRTFGHKTVSRLFPEMFGKATMDLVYDHTVDKLAVRYDPTQSFKSYHDLNFYQTLTPYVLRISFQVAQDLLGAVALSQPHHG
ncbi:hypothetical protein VTN31DRAFT_4144 [Thermomyces dupontii]|uniref:uncharacterized protein n=1 Tax=Talaromyces thermophilus TaxID=28565 RepID=UPI00374416BB